MMLADIILALLLSLPCPREPAEAEVCAAWRAEVAPSIAAAAEQTVAAGEWDGSVVELGALLVSVGYHESGFRRRIQAGECRPRECDSYHRAGHWYYPAQTMWQQHALPGRRAEHRAMVGTHSAAVEAAARGAARRLASGFRGCRTIAGAVSQYGGAKGCGWPGASSREKTWRKLMGQVTR
jgi:hypothetical protein